VHGRLKDTSGHWNWPISDKSEGRKSPQGATADRKPSSTLFRVTRDNSFFSDLELILETGRQHQIRKHAALASHPVAGDERYGDLRGPKTLKRLFAIDRMLLHAWRIELSFAGQKIEIEAPLPAEFSRVFEPPSIESK
jgi:23S rRNA-/tRNA-specific pseudouridylate synthase